MPNAVQLTQNGQPVYPRTDVSLVVGLQDAIKLPPVKVTTLPTASAETAGKMYYVGPDGNGEYERYITSIGDNNTYDWIDLGDTSIPLPSIADNETTDDPNMAHSAAGAKRLKDELGQLEAKVDELIPTVFEDGFFIVDGDGNIGFRVDENGITELIMSVLGALFTTTMEDGFYIIDSDRNIGFMVNTSGAHSANLVEY